jgi:DNA-binding SARP family transcriptional activator
MPICKLLAGPGAIKMLFKDQRSLGMQFLIVDSLVRVEGAKRMSLLNINLFGRFQVHCNGQPVIGLDIQKVQELFSYILLNRGKPQPRETLAGLLWGESSTEQSKRYLRQALWQLNTALDSNVKNLGHLILSANSGFIYLNLQSDLWLDVAEFENKFALVKGLTVHDLDDSKFQALQDGVQLYRGDLLEGWYQDWCLFERERLQNIYLAMLDKLMGYCEAYRLYELGVSYGASILRYDQAREYTHQGLMRLLYLSGDRTGALRQYQRCVAILDEELGVRPSMNTTLLHEQILADKVGGPVFEPQAGDQDILPDPASLPAALRYLRKFQTLLESIQLQLEQEIQSLERELGKH